MKLSYYNNQRYIFITIEDNHTCKKCVFSCGKCKLTDSTFFKEICYMCTNIKYTGYWKKYTLY